MDVMSVLVWLSGAGISAVSAFVLERINGFQVLSPNAKQSIAMVVAILVAIASMAAHDWLSSNPTALTAASPYLQIAITGVSILIQQIAHGMQRQGGNNG